MNLQKVKETAKEIARFTEKVTELISAGQNKSEEEVNHALMIGNKYSAAVRRASMDLTRSLSNLRK